MSIELRLQKLEGLEVPERVRPKVGGGQSMAQQHYKEQCDINHILARYKKSGIVDHVKKARALYGDFSQLAPHAENMDKVAKAQQAFEMLPAEIRTKHFNNSIPGFFEYISKQENFDQCVKWGIYDPRKEEASLSSAPAERAAVKNDSEPVQVKKSKKNPEE